MVGHFSLTPKRLKLVIADRPDSQQEAVSSTSSLNPVSLMLGAFALVKEDSDNMSNLEHTESSLSDSIQKQQPCKTRSILPYSPTTPATAASTAQLCPASSSSSSSVGFATSSMSGQRRNPWKWFRISSRSCDNSDGSQPNQELNRCLKLAPHIRKQLEISPCMLDSSASNSSGDELSISSNLELASVALEIVDNLLMKTTVKPEDGEIHNDEESYDSGHEPQIPKEIVCDDNLSREQQRRHKLTRLPRDDEFITLPEDDDDDLFEVSPRRGRTDSEEYEVVSL